jgi:hypothetical protein
MSALPRRTDIGEREHSSIRVEAVPQHVAGRRARKDRALPDAERRGGLDGRMPRREAAREGERRNWAGVGLSPK